MHPLYNYFGSLVEQFMRVIRPSEDSVDTLEAYSKDMLAVLKDVQVCVCPVLMRKRSFLKACRGGSGDCTGPG